MRLTHPLHGTAVIRDQRPLSEVRLEKCLDGMSVAEWFRLLNGRVFFWLEQRRLDVLRGAQVYREHRQTVLTLDTERLVVAYAPEILLTHMNTGATSPFAHPRGADTFVGIDDYPFARRGRVVELTISRAVPDIGEFVVRVDELGGGEAPINIWQRER